MREELQGTQEKSGGEVTWTSVWAAWEVGEGGRCQDGSGSWQGQQEVRWHRPQRDGLGFSHVCRGGSEGGRGSDVSVWEVSLETQLAVSWVEVGTDLRAETIGQDPGPGPAVRKQTDRQTQRGGGVHRALAAA